MNGQYLVTSGRTQAHRNKTQIISGLLPVTALAHKSNIRLLPVYFRSHNNPNIQYPVPLDKPVIFTVTSGLQPRMASEVTKVNNLEASE